MNSCVQQYFMKRITNKTYLNHVFAGYDHQNPSSTSVSERQELVSSMKKKGT
jgi:hypothetical protein